jgi:hypothetical protein
MDVGAVISAIHAASEMGRAPGNGQGEKDTTQNDSNNSHMIPFFNALPDYLSPIGFFPLLWGLQNLSKMFIQITKGPQWNGVTYITR